MRKKGLSLLMVLMLAMGMLMGTARAAEGACVETITFQGAGVGTATLSRAGTTLGVQAQLGAENVRMTSLRLTLGGAVVLDAASLSGAEARSLSRVLENVTYETMKAYQIEIGLISSDTERAIGAGDGVQERFVKSGTLPTPSMRNAKIGMRIELIRVNGQAASGPTLLAGDKLTFRLTFSQGGDAEARPDVVTLNVPSGLSTVKADNPDSRLGVSGDNLIYTHTGGMIPVGGTDSVEFCLAARAGAVGAQTIRASAAYLYDGFGERSANPTPNADYTVTLSAGSFPYGDPANTAPGSRLEVKHTLIRVNDAAVTPSTAIRPGDKLTLTMSLNNTGSAAVKPSQISVNFSSGICAESADNLNPPWAMQTNSITYTHAGTTIQPGTSQVLEYTLRVRKDAAGTQSVWTDVPTVLDVSGNTVGNGATHRVSLSLMITGDGGAVQITTKFWLSAVNGTATGMQPEGNPQRLQLVPGDVLTFTLRSINSGSQPVAPGEYTVTLPENQSFSAADNPGWTMGDGVLTYTYGGSMLAAGSQTDTMLNLKLGARAARGDQTYSYTYNLTRVRMPDGNTVSNHNPAMLQVQANVGAFGSMDKTGDTGVGWLPAMMGAMLLIGGGGVVLGTRRRGRRSA